MKIRKAVIPAAGLGTRFLPATKAQPKEMLPLVDKPTLQYIVEEAVASGIEEILLITGRGKNAIENHFDTSYELEHVLEEKGDFERLDMIRKISNMVDIQYTRQKEQKGLGHAIYCAKNFVGDEPFAVLLGDDVVYNRENPALLQLMDMYDKHEGTILGVQEVDKNEVDKYGIVAGEALDDRLTRVRTMVEKPSEVDAPSTLAVLGRYILTPPIIEYLENTKPGKGNEIQLTDAIMAMAQDYAVYAGIYEGRRYDVGSKLGFLEATVEYALRDPSLADSFKMYLKELEL